MSAQMTWNALLPGIQECRSAHSVFDTVGWVIEILLAAIPEDSHPNLE